ncbi:MAG: 1-acyl-sn-glycerol-3-phosphate acyltransferase [Alphaproteobacteria bacterium]
MLKVIAFLALTFPLMPVQALALVLWRDFARRLPGIYHRIIARIMGVDLVVTGVPVGKAPVLFIGNHVSYLDIIVLSAAVDGSFVAKAEIAGWPLFGWLAKLQRTIFIERRSRHVRVQRDEIGMRLEAGDNLFLFPEGTSNDGTHVRPFKSALFAVAERKVADQALIVQPFSIAYTRLDGLPIGRDWRPLYAWYGDMELPGHIWRLLGLGRVRADLIFHDPVAFDTFGTRKALADHCWRVVADGVARANSGAPAPVALPAAPLAPVASPSVDPT